ncbi:MAG: type II toxin-antitoxin system HicA family toxin [Pseudomonadota bacterium]
MPSFETNTRKIVARLEREGWVLKEGSEHMLFKHPRKTGRITVPRLREVSIGVARSIAKIAGCKE